MSVTTIPIYTAEKAKRLILSKKIEGPYEVTGWLDLRGCDLSGVTLPTTIGGWLDLSGCDLSGVTLPTTIGGWLYLRGCDLSGVTLPTTIGGSLDLSGAKNPDPSQWWTENGEATKRHCLVISDYALIETKTGKFIAGCRNFTRKQALAHWRKPRSDNAERAKLFLSSIEVSSA